MSNMIKMSNILAYSELPYGMFIMHDVTEVTNPLAYKWVPCMHLYCDCDD
jgi:hypothetical protein